MAFLVAGAALEQGKRVAMFLTKEAVRLALPGHAEAVACDGCPPLARLFAQFADARRRGARLPDLLRGPQARRRRADGQRAARRRHAAVAVDRQ